MVPDDVPHAASTQPGTPERPNEDQVTSDAIIERFFNPPPLVLVLSGPSGVGKDEVIHQMTARGLSFHFVVTATTRPQRAGEVDGHDYHFVSVAEFAKMIDHDDLLEHAVVYGDFKGIPKQQVRDALASGQDVVLRVDVQGARSIKQLLPEAIFVFLMADSMEELERRLRERKSEPPDRLKLRIATAREELRRVNEFDYIVMNRRDKLDKTVDFIQSILRAEKLRVKVRSIVL
ncbi:MAG: guanylate kinase [Anaerolineae bacterium]